MGKKKAKVKWTAVDDVPVNFSRRSEDPLDEPQVRGRETFKGNETLPPRFERKAAQKKNLVYYDGQFCETEELPNGFVKVRSKHLDVLFKRDFYTKKMERLFSPTYKRPNPEVFHSQLEEVREELTHYSCHNSSDGSIIYNIDHLLVSANVSFEMSTTTNPTAVQSANTSQEAEDAVNDFGQIKKDTSGEVMEENVDETHHPDHQDSGFADALMNPSPGKTRHDSGFIDSANIPFQSLTEDHLEIPEPCWDSQFLSHPAVYVYIPSGNELIPCEEVFVSPPGPRDPRCTCPTQTNIFLTGSSQNMEQLFQAGHPAAPGSQYHATEGVHQPEAPDFRHHAALDPSYHANTGPPYHAASGFPDHATSRPPYHATDGNRHHATDGNLHYAPSGPPHHALSGPPHHAPDGPSHHSVPVPGHYTTSEHHGANGFVNGPRLNPTEYVENNNFSNYDYNNINRIPMDDPNGLRYGPFVPNCSFIPFQQPQGPGVDGPNQNFHMDENEKDQYFDYDKPLMTSQPNDVSTKPNTYQLFPVDEKLHPVFGFNTSPSLVSNNDQVSPKKVIEPDYDWIKQLDEIEPKKQVIRANNSETRKMDPYFKQESVKPQMEVPSLKSPIPGLPLESLVRKKTQKKKKRKRKNTNDAKNLYSSDETGNGNGVEAKLDEEWFARDHPKVEVGSDMDSIKMEPHFELTSMKASFEVELSDALASSLVDPLAHFSSDNADNLNIQQVLVNSMADLVFDIVDENHGRELEVANKIIPTEEIFKKDTAVHETRNEENDIDVHLESNVDSFKSSSNNPMKTLVENTLIKKINVSLEEFRPACVEKKKQNDSERGTSDKIRTGGDATVARDEIALILEELISAAVKYNSDSKEDQHWTGNQKYKRGYSEITGPVQPKVGTESKGAKYIGSDQSAIETSQPKSYNFIEEDVEIKTSKESHHFILTPNEKQEEVVSSRKEKPLKVVVTEEKQLTKEKQFKEVVTEEKQFKVVTKEKHSKVKDDKSSTQNPSLLSTKINRKGKKAKKTHSSIQERGKADSSIPENSEQGSKLDEEETHYPVKRTKRRSKKEKSKSESVHRVIIDDSKVEIDLRRRVFRLTPELIDLILMNRFEDDIFVESLGFGMDHAWITQSRLPPSHLLQDLRSSSGNEESRGIDVTDTRELGEGNGDIGLD